MADKDFNFDEFLSEPKENKPINKRKPSTTRTTSNTDNISTTDGKKTLHPFSVRLDKPYIDKIKAIAWWKQISQREVIELAVDQFLEELDPQDIESAISEFVKKHFNDADT